MWTGGWGKRNSIGHISGVEEYIYMYIYAYYSYIYHRVNDTIRKMP